jgi:hypothetical protein
MYKCSARTSKETYFVSATVNVVAGKQSLFITKTLRNTQIHCEGRMQCSTIYIKPVRTSQETHYVSATESNQLMLLRERFAVYCENHTEHTDTL